MIDSGQFAKTQSGRLGPAPGRFELSTNSSIMGFETLDFNRKDKSLRFEINSAINYIHQNEA